MKAITEINTVKNPLLRGVRGVFYTHTNNDNLLNRVLLKFDKLIRKHLLYILFLVGFFAAAQTQPKVTTNIDTTKIRIGERINFEIVVDNADKGVVFSELQLDNLGRIEVVESFDIDTLKNRLIKKYALTSFDSGSYIIPRQRITIWSQEYLTDSLKIDVSTVAVDTTKQKMFTIKAIQNEPYTFQDFKQYLWWLLLAALLIGLILYFVLRKKETIEEIEARIPPYQLALKKLSELDKKELWQQNKVKQYYIELTDIVRNYIERGLRIPALELTTDELIETINDFNSSSSLNIPNDAIIKLQKLLKESDLVKFAKSKPLMNEIELHRGDAEDIVNTMRPTIVGSMKINDIKNTRQTIIVQKPTYKTPSMLVKILIILGLLLIGFFFMLSISNAAKTVGNIKKAAQQNALKIDIDNVE